MLNLAKSIIFILIVLFICSSLGIANQFEEISKGLNSNNKEEKKESLEDLLTYYYSQEKPEKEKDVLNVMFKVLDDEDPEIRSFGIGVLCKTHDARIIVPLVRMLDDQSADVRATAASAFAIHAEPNNDKLRIKLHNLLKDPNPRVKIQALIALQGNGSKKTIENIKILLETEEDDHIKEVAKQTISYLELKYKIVKP